MNARGRDISKYDRVVDFNEFDFYIIRAYSGVAVDPKYHTWTEACSRPNFPYAFYDFRYRAAPQAIDFWEIVKGDCPPVLAFDVEEWGKVPFKHSFPPRLNLLAGLKELVDQLSQLTGMLPMSYMNPAAIKYLMPIPDWLLACPLWIAHWEYKPTLLNKLMFWKKPKPAAVATFPSYAPWNKWTVHQTQGEPDLNWFNGTKGELIEWLYGPPPPEQSWDWAMDSWARTKGYTGPKPGEVC